MALPALTLRPPVLADEQVFRQAHARLAEEGVVFGLGLSGLSWPYYLHRLAEIEAGQDPHGRVPASFLLAEVAGVVVGRTSIRHELDEELAVVGGHIGYCVLPEHRRRGYATEILRQSLPVARSHGVTRALLTCDETNTASRKVIEHCGGVLESTDGRTRRYWIDQPDGAPGGLRPPKSSLPPTADKTARQRPSHPQATTLKPTGRPSPSP